MQSNAKKFGKVAVLMGGWSSEREVSLMSGNAVLAALLRQGIDAHRVDVQRDICSVLAKEKFDRVFIALHGAGGEDGVIQGVLETMQIPYTGSDVAASALAMDKERTKYVWQALGLPTLPFELIDENTDPKKIIDRYKLPLAIKPVTQGSTLGVTKVTSIEQFKTALKTALQLDKRVMVERWIEGDEFTVGILKDEALPIIKIVAAQSYYDYQAKYFSDETQYLIPSGLSAQLEKHVQEISLAAYKAVGCRHWGRVDIMQDRETGKFWLLEVNTIPGLTDHSLVPKAAKAVGVNFDELVVSILAETL